MAARLFFGGSGKTMKKKTKAYECQEGLCLHDARVRDIRITEINCAERNVNILLDTSQAMSDASMLRLEHCRKLEMEDIAGCWWMGERLTHEDNGVFIEAELVTASGEKRRLVALCHRLLLE